MGLYLREYKQREEQELSKIMATQFVNLKWRSTPNMKFLFNEDSVVTADLLNDGVELLTPVLGTWKFTIAGKILTIGKTFKNLKIPVHPTAAGHNFTVTFTPAVVKPAVYKATTITRKVFVTPSLVTLAWSKDQYTQGYWLPLNNPTATNTNFATVNGLKGATQFLGHSAHMGNTPRAIGNLYPVSPDATIGYKYPNYPLPFSGITSDSTYNASFDTMLFNGDTFWWEIRKTETASFYKDVLTFLNATTLPLVNDKISTGFKEINYNKPASFGPPRLKYGLQHYTDPKDPHFGYHWMYWSVLQPNGKYTLFFNSSLKKFPQSALPTDSVVLYPNLNYPNKEATFNPVSYCTGYLSGYAFDSGYYACNNVEGVNVCENFIESLVSTGVVTGTDITNGRWISTGCAGTGIAGSLWDLDFFTGAAYPSLFNNLPTTLKELEVNYGYINKKWRTRMYVGFSHVSPDGRYSRVEQAPVNVEINVKAYNA